MQWLNLQKVKRQMFFTLFSTRMFRSWASSPWFGDNSTTAFPPHYTYATQSKQLKWERFSLDYICFESLKMPFWNQSNFMNVYKLTLTCRLQCNTKIVSGQHQIICQLDNFQERTNCKWFKAFLANLTREICN